MRTVSGDGRFDVSIWGPIPGGTWMETYTWLDSRRRDALIDFAWRHDLRYRVDESRGRGGVR